MITIVHGQSPVFGIPDVIRPIFRDGQYVGDYVKIKLRARSFAEAYVKTNGCITCHNLKPSEDGERWELMPSHAANVRPIRQKRRRK